MVTIESCVQGRVYEIAVYAGTAVRRFTMMVLSLWDGLPWKTTDTKERERELKPGLGPITDLFGRAG